MRYNGKNRQTGDVRVQRYFAWFGLKGSLVLTILLSLLAGVLAAIHPSQARLLCFAAMAMSSAGDIFLMHFECIETRFRNFFVIGAAFFMLAHVLYALCYGMLAAAAGAAGVNAGTWAALCIAGVCFLYFTAVCARRRDFSSYPLALTYLLIISLNCASVFTYSAAAFASKPAALTAAAGAASFLLSDLIIGLGLLADDHRLDHLIWWFYPVGQILLIVMAGG